MKRILLMLATLSIAGVFSAYSIASDYSMQVGQEIWTIVYEDQSLSDLSKAVLSQELARFFTYTTNLVAEFPEDWTTDLYRNYLGTSHINMPTVFQRGLGITNAQSRELRVFTDFTDHYRVDGEVYGSYTNLHDGADQFVSNLNDGSVTNRPIAELRNLFLILPSPPPSWTDAEILRNLNELTHLHIFQPCLFKFHLEPAAAGFTEPIPAFDIMWKTDETIHNLTIVYVDEAWKFIDIVE